MMKQVIDNGMITQKLYKEEKENYEQVLYSVAIEPSLKEAIKVAGKNRGRVRGGAKSIVRDAMTNYFKKHSDLFE